MTYLQADRIAPKRSTYMAFVQERKIRVKMQHLHDLCTCTGKKNCHQNVAFAWRLSKARKIFTKPQYIHDLCSGGKNLVQNIGIVSYVYRRENSLQTQHLQMCVQAGKICSKTLLLKDVCTSGKTSRPGRLLALICDWIKKQQV